jgi:hypothetical protein
MRIIMVLGLAILLTGCAALCEDPCKKPETFGAAPETDFLGNECGKPVYRKPGCPQLPSWFTKPFADIHEAIFDCEEDPQTFGAQDCGCK